MDKKFSRLIQHLILIVGGVVLMYGCSDEDAGPVQGNSTPCVIATAPSYFNTTQTFGYKDGNMAARTYEFGFAGYGPFMETVDKLQVRYTYVHNVATITETDTYLGGTGSLYDGQPDLMVKQELQTYTDGREAFVSGPDSVLFFTYDNKKRLITSAYAPKLNLSSVYTIYGKQLYNIKLDITYDDNDNVTTLKQTYIYREGSYNVNIPSASYFFYTEDVQTIVHYTYDDKPSPFTSIGKYWIFVQGDWGYTINSDWHAIVTALSKNNPLTMTFEVREGNPSTFLTNYSYHYNEQGFPMDGYTYNCK